MADKPALFDERTAREILEMVRDWKANGRRFEKAGLKQTKTDRGAPILHLLRVTSTTATSGMYPARIVNFESDSTTPEQVYEEVRVVGVGPGTISTTYYFGRLMGVRNGYPVYSIVLPTADRTYDATLDVLVCVSPVIGTLSQDVGGTVRLDGTAIGTSGVSVVKAISRQEQTISVSSVGTLADCVKVTTDDCCPVTVGSVHVTGLHNTGKTFSQGDIDTNWSNAWVSTYIEPYPFPNDATSKWITNAATAAGDSEAGCDVTPCTHDYETTFTATDAGLAEVNGRFLADNEASIWLNGVQKYASFGEWGAWTEFSITDGFALGANTLLFRLTDYGVIQNLRVEFY